MKAYEQGLTLFELEDPDFDARVTRSERDRATANCVLHYAAQHHPRLILVECTTELTSWGPALPGRKKVGDGSHLPVVAQAVRPAGLQPQGPVPELAVLRRAAVAGPRYWVFVDKSPADARPGAPPSVAVRPLRQGRRGRLDVADRHPADRHGALRQAVRLPLPVLPPPGRPADDAVAGRARPDRPRDPHRRQPVKTFPDGSSARSHHRPWPAPNAAASASPTSPRAHARQGCPRLRAAPVQPMATQTSQQETALLSTGPAFSRCGPRTPLTDWSPRRWRSPWTTSRAPPRGAGEPLPTQVGSETLALVSSGVIPYRKNTLPTLHSEAMPTFTSEQIPAVLTAAGTLEPTAVAGVGAVWRAALSELRSTTATSE